MNFSYRTAYIISLILVSLSLIFSEFTLSVSLIILAGLWIIEGKFKEKISYLKNNKHILLVPAIFLIELIGLFWTQDFDFAFARITKRLPLYILPLIIATSPKLIKCETKIIFYFFLAGLFVQSWISLFIYFGWVDYSWHDIREISIYISHIRLALMVVFGILIALYYTFHEKKLLIQLILLLVTINLLMFLYILNSLTGYITISALIIYNIAYLILKSSSKKIKAILSLVLISLVFVVFYLSRIYIDRYFQINEYEKPYKEYTINQNRYEHKKSLQHRENGYKVWVYVSRKEIEEEWNKRSHIDINGKDLKDQPIYATCVRYLASKGLKKDSTGIWSLSQKDITNIENGIANHLFTKDFSLYSKIYPVIWQIERYKSGGTPEGHSITLRAEYLQAAFYIIKQNLWFGTGTGDAKKEFKKAYKETGSNLDQKYQRRAHNQYVTFILTYGITGFTIIMIMLIAPVIKEKGLKDYLFTIFFLIFLMSMLNEDTLETHTAVSFVGFWYAFLLFGRQNIHKSN